MPVKAVFWPTERAEHPLAPPEEVAANRAERQRQRDLIEPLEEREEELEKPYHDMIVAQEVAKLPQYMRDAWNTPEGQRTEGQRLNVTQIQRTLEVGSLRDLVKEELHATILHTRSLDFENLTYRFNGRDMRLTDVHGKVIEEILA